MKLTAPAGIRVRLRQWKHPREFRVSAPQVPSDQDVRVLVVLAEHERLTGVQAELSKVIATLSATRSERDTSQAARDAAQAELDAAQTALAAASRAADPLEALGVKKLARLGTLVWKAQQSLEGDEDGYLRTTIMSLEKELGLTFQDHTGNAYDPGHTLEVQSVKRILGATGATVIETVEPSVYLHGKLVQVAVVVLGCPPIRRGD